MRSWGPIRCAGVAEVMGAAGGGGTGGRGYDWMGEGGDQGRTCGFAGGAVFRATLLDPQRRHATV